MSVKHTYNKQNPGRQKKTAAGGSSRESKSRTSRRRPSYIPGLSMKRHSRYERQIILKEIGREGQKKLDKARVAVVGLGALGSVSANLLARAGIGRLILIDRDFLELSNLQRQVLYDEKDIELNFPKAVAAERKLRTINSQIKIQGIVADVSPSNLEELLGGVDLIVDGTDNFETRFLLNDFALHKKIPWIYGGAVRTEGMSYVILPGIPPCLRCLFGEMPPRDGMQTCDQVGILSPVAHLIASFQATEAIKILAGKLDQVDRKLWKVDIWNRHFKSFSVEHLKSSPCSGCSKKNFPYLERKLTSHTTVLCGRNAVQIYEPREGSLDLDKIAGRLSAFTNVKNNSHLLHFRLDPYEMTVFKNGRAIIKGTENIGQARSFYAQYIGA